MAAWAMTTEQFPLLDDQKNIQIYGTRKFMQCLESSSVVPVLSQKMKFTPSLRFFKFD
jgi:hypothetical protein